MYEAKEDQKVRLASQEFLDYAIQWWHQNVMDIGLNKRPTVVSWSDLKLCMHARFVHPCYRKELLLKFQRLQQRSRRVDEYFKDLEVTLTKINMHESEDSKIVRFVSGLQRETQDVIELYEYNSLEKLVHLAIKVESQVLKNCFTNTHNVGFYKSSWKGKNKFQNQDFPSNFSKQTTPYHKPSTPKSHPKPQVKNTLNV